MNLIQEINSVCNSQFPAILVGSRSLDNCFPGYKVSEVRSDYDFIVSIRHWNQILGVVDKNVYVDPMAAGPAVRESNYNKGIKFFVKPKLEKFEINLIPLHESEYHIWKQANVALLALAASDEQFRVRIQNKERRIAVYEQFKATIKLTLA
jgi:hypothetical protein